MSFKKRWRQPSAVMQFTALRALMEGTFENWREGIIPTSIFKSRFHMQLLELRALELFINGKDWESR